MTIKGVTTMGKTYTIHLKAKPNDPDVIKNVGRHTHGNGLMYLWSPTRENTGREELLKTYNIDDVEYFHMDEAPVTAKK